MRDSNPASVKKSNTSANDLSTQLKAKGEVFEQGGSLRRTHNTSYHSFRDYSPVYGTATIGRGGVFKSNLRVLTEDHHGGNSSRKMKRTESFV